MSEIEITGVFEDVLGMIYSAKQKAEYQVNSTIIDLYYLEKFREPSRPLPAYIWNDKNKHRISVQKK